MDADLIHVIDAGKLSGRAPRGTSEKNGIYAALSASIQRPADGRTGPPAGGRQISVVHGDARGDQKIFPGTVPLGPVPVGLGRSMSEPRASLRPGPETAHQAPQRSETNTPILIGCFWHGRMIMMSSNWHPARPLHLHLWSSGWQDGCEWCGSSVSERWRGSTRRGGANALRALCFGCEDGGSVELPRTAPMGPECG